jgi:flavin-binding protein dodecin
MKHSYVIELTGQSPSGWSSAVKNAVARASEDFDNITGVEITSFQADVQHGELVGYKANMKISYAEY